MDWRLVQGAQCLRPLSPGIGSSTPCDPFQDKAVEVEWINEWMNFLFGSSSVTTFQGVYCTQCSLQTFAFYYLWLYLYWKTFNCFSSKHTALLTMNLIGRPYSCWVSTDPWCTPILTQCCVVALLTNNVSDLVCLEITVSCSLKVTLAQMFVVSDSESEKKTERSTGRMVQTTCSQWAFIV